MTPVLASQEVVIRPRKRKDPASDEWCTPRDLAVDLGAFDVDPCSNDRSHVRTERRICLPENGLVAEWSGSVFVNPPYSNPMPWCQRLALHRGPWVALLKLDPTTKWFAELVRCGASHAAFRKRLTFERPGKKPMTANFPSVLAWHWWTPPTAIAERLWLLR